MDDVTVTLERELRSLVTLGAIEYYLPSDPAGERFVVGMNGQILNMDPEQVMCFVSGALAVSSAVLSRVGAL